jgi:hypothetical protein
VDRLARTLDVDVIIRTAIGAFYTDRLPGCRTALERVVRDGRDGGALGAAMRALLVVAFDDLNRGRWDAAEEATTEAIALCEESGYRLYEWTGGYGQALLAASRGDTDTCADIYSLTRGARTAVRDRAWPRITRYQDRWSWLTASVIPQFRRLDLQPNLVRTSLTRITEEASAYAAMPCLPPITTAS